VSANATVTAGWSNGRVISKNYIVPLFFHLFKHFLQLDFSNEPKVERFHLRTVCCARHFHYFHGFIIIITCATGFSTP
jgi:hypothetical protein